MKRFVFIFIFILVAFTFVFVISLPSILSTDWGKHRVESFISQRTGSAVKIGSLNLSLFGKQSISDFELESPAQTLNFKTFQTKTPFWTLYFSGLTRKTVIESLNGRLKPLNKAPIFFNSVNAKLTISNKHEPAFIRFSGLTKSENTSGTFEVDIGLKHGWNKFSFDTLSDININSEIKNFPVKLIDYILELRKSKFSGLAEDLLGPTLNLSIADTYNKEVLEFKVNLFSSRLKSKLIGQIDNQVINLQKNGHIQLSIPSNLTKQFGLRILKDVPIDFTLNTFRIPISFFSQSVKKTNYDLDVSMKSGPVQTREITLSEFKGQLTTSNTKINVQLDANVLQNGQKLPIVVTSSYEKVSNISKTVETLLRPRKLDVRFNEFPLAFVDELFDLDKLFQTYLGQKATLNLSTSDKNINEINISFKSDKVEIPQGAIELDLFQTGLKTEKLSGKIHFNNTRFTSLDQTSELIIQKLLVPWSFNLTNYQFSSEFSLDQLKLTDKSEKQSINFSRATGHFTNDTNRSQFNLKIIDNHTPLMESKGIFDRLADNSSLSVTFNKSPISLLTRVFDQNYGNKIGALLGVQLNGTIKADLNNNTGSININLKGNNGAVEFNGLINNGFLGLNKPVLLTVNPTPELGKYVLQDLVPFLSTLQTSNTPIKIIVDPENFRYPIKSFDASQIMVKQITLDLGRQTFENSGELKSILNLLQDTKDSYVPLWFTPLYVQVNNGIVHVYRTDMLVDERYHISTWGQVNLVKDKVNLTIGLSSEAISAALGIQEVQDDGMLLVKLKGKIGKTKIDQKSAAIKIGALVAKSQGNEGKIIGTLLDIASDILTKKNVPAPTTQPFPWEESKTWQKKHSNQKSSKNIKDEAKSLLESLFR